MEEVSINGVVIDSDAAEAHEGRGGTRVVAPKRAG